VARYHAEGVRTVLVCCTGGEEGEILNPAMDIPSVHGRIHEVRREELAAATAIIGYDETVWLGYRDSGMAGAPSNEDPRSFAMAPLEEAVGRLVAVIRRERPQVMVTYPDEQREYPHPDHLRVHEISLAAWEAAADPDRYPEAGPAWAVAKLYYTMWPRQQMLATHEKFVELGLESPFGEEWLERLRRPEPVAVTTSIDIEGFGDVRSRALRAHATQVDPTSKMWFGLPPEVQAAIHPYDDYRLAASRVGPLDGPEDDLFANVG
jgi:mycothiol S-conjugate amidase